MSATELTFVEKYVRGMAKKEQIIDHITEWHDSESYHIPLHLFLGLSEEEHLDYVNSDTNLDLILNKKRKEHVRSKMKLIITPCE